MIVGLWTFYLSMGLVYEVYGTQEELDPDVSGSQHNYNIF